jgi:hypothetical protein
MDFDGLIDLSKKENSYDFRIKVDYANLKFVSDSISNFKGDVLVQVAGKHIDNLQGNIYIKETLYQNTKDTYALMILTLIPASIQKELEQ